MPWASDCKGSVVFDSLVLGHPLQANEPLLSVLSLRICLIQDMMETVNIVLSSSFQVC